MIHFTIDTHMKLSFNKINKNKKCSTQNKIIKS